jgi:hypothetical protein
MSGAEVRGMPPDDRLAYRIAVMEALKRCSPMPFTSSQGGAIAGAALRDPVPEDRSPAISI